MGVHQQTAGEGRGELQVEEEPRAKMRQHRATHRGKGAVRGEQTRGTLRSGGDSGWHPDPKVQSCTKHHSLWLVQQARFCLQKNQKPPATDPGVCWNKAFFRVQEEIG